MIRLLKFVVWSGFAVVCGLALSLSGAFLYINPTLPSVEALRSIQLQIPLRIFSSDGKLIAEYGEMRRTPIDFEAIPRDFIEALLAAEDDNFANHYGVDISGLMRAATQLLKSGQIQSGGSTITMQVAKNYFLTSEKSFSRKITEILLALQIERELSKQEIFELYVNKIYLGNRAYGIEAAAQIYYGKSIQDLTLAQMAMIAGLPKAPSRYNPVVNPERSKERRDWILGRMYRLGKIDQQRYMEAVAEPVDVRLHISVPELNAPYVAEMVRAEMVGLYGSDAYTEGFRVYTTVPSDLQHYANQAVQLGLQAYDQRHGYRGPEARYAGQTREAWQQRLAEQRSIGGLQPAIVTEVLEDGILVMTQQGEEPVAWETMKWARPYVDTDNVGEWPQQPAEVVAPGDLIRVLRQPDGTLAFTQLPTAQSALVSLDPRDGAILALVGGFSFDQSNYNRVVQARRQPGSSFKPFLYSAALDRGYTPATLVNDAPIVYQDNSMDEAWRPKNDNNTFLGPIRLREALYRSRNLVSIRLLQNIGIQYGLNYMERFGFPREHMPRDLSLALGTAALTPMEITAGWAVFANGGYKVNPYLIQRVENRDGETIYQANPPRAPRPGEAPAETPADGLQTASQTSSDAPSKPRVAEQILDPRTAYILDSMLKDVITKGTGRRAQALERDDLAGKTGTTNDSKDAWFTGYNGDYVTTVWAGFDQPESLGRWEYGGTVALPIWMNFMGPALEGKPSHTLPEPKGLLTLRVDPVTGRAASAYTPNAYFEIFKAEDAPPSLSELDSGAPGSPLPADEVAPIDLF
ncbi:MAG TPA: penicillin-binding protein 1A [Pseudomonas sp.]|nr:penicillin-binding protein 1A [Pseudomonas sp.]